MTKKFDDYFKDLLINYEIPKDLALILQKYEDLLNIFIYKEDENMFYLQDLKALQNAPKGTGSAFMYDLCGWADKNKITLTLQTGTKAVAKSATYKNTTSSNRLVKFYKRFGFVSNYSKRNYRADLKGNMHRDPR